MSTRRDSQINDVYSSAWVKWMSKQTKKELKCYVLDIQLFNML